MTKLVFINRSMIEVQRSLRQTKAILIRAYYKTIKGDTTEQELIIAYVVYT